MKAKDSFELFFRYILIVLLGLPGSYFFYLAFNPLTIYPSFWLLKLIYPIALGGNTFFIGDYAINIAAACIAGAAYYLLLILNLATPMKLRVRLASLSFLFLSFLFLNILRLIAFTILFVEGYSYFDLAHRAVWYIGSTLLVVALWFFNARMFKIRAIPAYSDVKSLFFETRRKKN